MYHDLEAQLHDLFWDAEGASSELPLLESFLKAYPGDAFELGCGSGRLLIPLLEKGYTIEGLDNSAEMLALCKQRSHEDFPDLKLYQSDMQGFNPEKQYSAVAIPAFTLQFLCHQEIPEFLHQLYHMIEPNGGLYLTTFIPWAEITGELEEDVWFSDKEIQLGHGDAATCQTRFAIQRLSQRLMREHRYTFKSADGSSRTTKTNHSLHWFWLQELDKFLANSGFRIQKVITDFCPEASPDENAQILTIIAEKTATKPFQGRHACP